MSASMAATMWRGTILRSRGSSTGSAGLEARGGFARKVGEDAVRAGALEAEERFHDHALVEPAALDRAAQHRVLAAHLIGEGRQLEAFLHAPDHVEIGHARLHHHHVGALGD